MDVALAATRRSRFPLDSPPPAFPTRDQRNQLSRFREDGGSRGLQAPEYRLNGAAFRPGPYRTAALLTAQFLIRTPKLRYTTTMPFGQAGLVSSANMLLSLRLIERNQFPTRQHVSLHRGFNLLSCLTRRQGQSRIQCIDRKSTRLNSSHL